MKNEFGRRSRGRISRAGRRRRDDAEAARSMRVVRGMASVGKACAEWLREKGEAMSGFNASFRYGSRESKRAVGLVSPPLDDASFQPGAEDMAEELHIMTGK